MRLVYIISPPATALCLIRLLTTVKIGYDQCLTGSGCTDGPVAAVMYTLCTDEDCENDPDVEVECTAPHTDSTEGGSDGGSGGSGATSSAMGVVAALISLGKMSIVELVY